MAPALLNAISRGSHAVQELLANELRGDFSQPNTYIMTEALPDVSFEDFIQSDLFTFHVGDERKSFVVHSKAVAATSEYFGALVNGDMAESQTRSAELRDVQPDDFLRYLEYAYRRDYTVPPWVQDDNVVEEKGSNSPLENSIIPLELGGETTECELYRLGSEHITMTMKEAMKASLVQAALRSTFERHNHLPDGAPSAAMLRGFENPSNTTAHQNFTPIFLAHARLYTFACMRLVDLLKNLALHKLHRTLLDFQLYHQRVGDVIELARYAYDNGKDRDEDGTIDDLRRLVVEYIACKVSTFGTHKDFVRMLEEGGEFVSDFWGIVVKEVLL